MIRPFSAIQVSFSRALKALCMLLHLRYFSLASDITKALFDFILGFRLVQKGVYQISSIKQ